MTGQSMFWIMGFITAVSLLLALAAWIGRGRWTRDYRQAAEAAGRAKDAQIVSLEQQLSFVRELDSLKFTERYIATKKGLEERIARLRTELSDCRAGRENAQKHIDDLTLDAVTRSNEIDRLRSDLVRANQDAQRLEQIVQAVHTVGPISIDEIRAELSKRRRLAAHIKGRLEMLSLDGEAKEAEVERLRAAMDERKHTVERLAREIEITRSAGAIVDAMLGIDGEARDKLARHVGEQLEDSVRRLTDARGRDPIADFLSAIEKGRARDGRLLAAGEESREPPPSTLADVQTATRHPVGADAGGPSNLVAEEVAHAI